MQALRISKEVSSYMIFQYFPNLPEGKPWFAKIQLNLVYNLKLKMLFRYLRFLRPLKNGDQTLIKIHGRKQIF